MTKDRAIQILDMLMHGGEACPAPVPEDCRNIALHLGKLAIDLATAGHNAIHEKSFEKSCHGCRAHRAFWDALEGGLTP